MAKDYKLCPKCNNALDLNVSKCPYCGETMGMNFGFEKKGYSESTNNTPPKETKDSKGCYIIFLIFFILPFIGSVISIIWGLISSWLDH